MAAVERKQPHMQQQQQQQQGESKLHLILPSTGLALLLGLAGWLVYSRGSAGLELDDSMSLIMAATTVMVMSAIHFLPLYHDQDGTTVVLVSMPFGAMATAAAHFIAQAIQLATGLGASPARLLLACGIFAGVSSSCSA